MSDGGRLQKPGAPTAEHKKAADDPTSVGNSVDADRAWAQNRIANFFRSPRVMRKATGDTAAQGDAAPQITATRAPGIISLAKKDDNKTDDKKPQRNMSMLGANGTQCTSKTMWKGKGKERIDVENPNPGQRPGQIHYQDNDDNKYLYDPATKTFKGAPKVVSEKLKDPQFAAGIAKAMALLGEKP